MAITQNFNLGGINLFLNPLLKKDGDALRAVNVQSSVFGAKTKRTGYATFLGTADGSAVNSLFSWTQDDGSLFLYRASGSTLYHSVEGTGAWTLGPAGTITAGSAVGHAVSANNLMVGDGLGSTRLSTDGTTFTNTTLAPVASQFVQFQGRMYAMGTGSDLFYSNAGSPADWSTTGGADSSSFEIPGGGKLLKVIKVADRVIATKSSGVMYKWDGYSLVDMATELGPTSPYSAAQVEGFNFWLNRKGIYGYGGDRPDIVSNPVQPQIYNPTGSAIAGGTFDTAQAVVHMNDYLIGVGTITEDLTNETINDAIIKYDFNKNEFLNYRFNNFPTAWHSYKDADGDQQLIFGDKNGQCYKMSGTTYADNASPIEVVLEYVIHLGTPEYAKKWSHFRAWFNPGNECKVQIAVEDTFVKESKRWKELGDCSTGYCDFRFPTNTRGRLLFVKIYESSTHKPFTFYGFSIDAEPIIKT